ncbi:MAG: acyl-CoA thioesterase [Acidimicrobiales bacterium]
MTRFADDTAVTRITAGHYAATIDPGWWIERGPNGGYLAAIVLRAVLAEVDEPARRPRSMTLHYLRPPVEGPCEVLVTVERVGRGLSTVSARLSQAGRDCIIGLVALGHDRPGPELHDHLAPEVPGPDEVEPRPTDGTGGPDIPFRQRYDLRPALGSPPFTSGPAALTGGWIRTVDHDPVDDVLVAALTDAWPPAVFSRLDVPIGVPTVELTVHFRGAPSQEPGWCLVRFRTNEASDGYLDEDGEVWSADGRLLAESRQLAVLISPS